MVISKLTKKVKDWKSRQLLKEGQRLRDNADNEARLREQRYAQEVEFFESHFARLSEMDGTSADYDGKFGFVGEKFGYVPPWAAPRNTNFDSRSVGLLKPTDEGVVMRVISEEPVKHGSQWVSKEFSLNEGTNTITLHQTKSFPGTGGQASSRCALDLTNQRLVELDD